MDKRDELVAALSRNDFLRASLLGTAGLGLPAALAAAPADRAASGSDRQGYVVAVTHGPSDPTRVMLALFTATRLLRRIASGRA